MVHQTLHPGYFTSPLDQADPQVAAAVANELDRQRYVIELIASENIVSRAVLEAQGSILTNKTVEGYPGHRHHGGAVHVDVVERLAIERACRLFDCRFANVQPHSGSQANQVVFLATVRPGQKVLSMDLAAGGHLSHGAQVNMSGQWFDIVSYGVRPDDALIDYDRLEQLARQHTPKLIVAGGSAYPRVIDFSRLGAIAREAGACFLVDMAHFSGLVAAGVHPSPLPHADVVTTTTYKSLRGPRGAIILSNDALMAKRIDEAVFPGLQGSCMLHVMAAKAVCLGEALQPEFRAHGRAVLANARALARKLADHGFPVVTGGTDTPLMLVDLRSRAIKGSEAVRSLERAGITCNRNPLPFDADLNAGLRFGVSACTTRGFGVGEFALVGQWIAQVLDGLAANRQDTSAVEQAVYAQVRELTDRFPIYPAA